VSEKIRNMVKKLDNLPYLEPPYNSRSWGNELHRLCSYPSKMKPAIAHFLVDIFTTEGQTVLDPFSGIGTIPLESCLQGRIGLGNDLSPLCYLATLAKTNVPSKYEIDSALANLEKLLEKVDHELILKQYVVEEEISSFWEKRTLAEILISKQYIQNELKNSNNKASIAFLGTCIAHILHGNRPYALSRRSHNVIPIPPKGEFVYKPLLKSLREKIDRAMRCEMPETYVKGRAMQRNALDMNIDPETIDTIITSPPFLGTTDFLRQNRVRLWFSGWNYDKQAVEKKKGDFFEYKKGMDFYAVLLDEFYRVLKKGSCAILHLGVVKSIDMAKEIEPLIEYDKFKLYGIVYEDTQNMESQGRTDRGSTHKHQFMILQKR